MSCGGVTFVLLVFLKSLVPKSWIIQLLNVVALWGMWEALLTPLNGNVPVWMCSLAFCVPCSSASARQLQVGTDWSFFSDQTNKLLYYGLCHMAMSIPVIRRPVWTLVTSTTPSETCASWCKCEPALIKLTCDHINIQHVKALTFCSKMTVAAVVY